MSFGGLIRRLTFWTIDFCHKSPVGKPYRDIAKILANKNNAGFQGQQSHINDVLEYFVKNSLFHKDCDPSDLGSFPVINKFVIRDNYESLKITPEDIPEHKGEIQIQRTSGSTGTPLAIPMDSRKRKRRLASLKYFGKIAGYNSHEKLAQLRIWTKWQNKSRKQTFRENIFAVDCSKIDDNMFDSLCSLINEKGILAIWGYASWFERLAEYIERKSIKLPSLKVLMAGSEMLQPSVRVKLKELLDCTIVSRYSNEEQGILGQDRDGDEQYYLNHANYYFEFLKIDSDAKAEPGEVCRIVITDLFNYAFPMLRYDTGDTGIYTEKNENSNGFPVLSKIYGRLLDLVYDVNGTPVHPMSLARILKNYDGIELWQFIQNDASSYELKLKLSSSIDLTDCTEQLKNIFGKKSDINIVQVEDIPVLASGKRKPVMNKWKNN